MAVRYRPNENLRFAHFAKVTDDPIRRDHIARVDHPDAVRAMRAVKNYRAREPSPSASILLDVHAQG